MTQLEKLSGCDNPERSIDLIFVHGLDGDARSTWQRKDRPETFWPGWIGEKFPGIGVWSLDYDANSIAWRGDSMPLYDRANNVLNCFEQEGIAQRPIAFICHSLGGLLIKQVLRNASDSKHPSWSVVGKQTRFILLLSTPHSGSGMAN
ncbi:MAG: esterase/lipase family protein [Gammaproteobacteria bacterium]